MISEWLPAMCDVPIHSTWASLCRSVFEFKCSAVSVLRYLTTEKTDLFGSVVWLCGGCFCCLFVFLPSIDVRTQSNLSSTKITSGQED